MPFGQVPEGFFIFFNTLYKYVEGESKMQKPKVAIVGAGKVGSVLARTLYSCGYQLVGILSSTLESADKLATELGTLAGTKMADLVQNAQMILITTPDRCIGEVVEQIAKDNGFKSGQVVMHASGGLPVEILQPAREQGAFVGCMHPLQSFANKEHTSEILSGVYFALSGQDEMITQAKKMVEDFGGRSFIILDKDKALYHAAACIASNYTVSLMHWASQIYSRFGLSSEEASAALLPLLQGTVRNIREMGATQGLTGPISRGDSITVEAHLAALASKKEKNLYTHLGMYTLGVALEKGSIDHEQALNMTKILKSKGDVR
jgi:predicted short-subunit dehydrogenase-like oxidoreductase (DUF2520 family)